MITITAANMKRGVLLHKMIVAEVCLVHRCGRLTSSVPCG
jgi:hypothetical protein